VASDIRQALGPGGFRRSADGAPHASFAAASRAWDRAAPALAPALGAMEPRNSVLVSRAGEGMGQGLPLVHLSAQHKHFLWDTLGRASNKSGSC